MTNIGDDELLRLEQVLRVLKISKSSFYAGIKTGRFPISITLGPRTRRWRAKDIKVIVEHGVEK